MDWLTNCPNSCSEKHEFVVNESGEFDLVCVINWSRNILLVKAPKANFLKLVQEPNWGHRFSHRFVNRHSRLFKLVRGHAKVQSRSMRGTAFEQGYAFLPHHVEPGQPEKTKMLSIISSTLAQLPGQIARNNFVNSITDPDIQQHMFGRGRREMLSKTEGLDDYRFTLAVENSAIPGYFTEKITDPILRECVPIYFGAPDVLDYFPSESVLILPSLTLEAFRDVLALVSEKEYLQRLPALREAKRRLIEEYRLCCWLSNKLQDEFLPTNRKALRILGLSPSEVTYRVRLRLGSILKRRS